MKRPLLLPVALLVAWACILAALPVVQASCDDAVHNDAETDVDCGGPACDACAVGKSCSSGSDCEHGSCSVRSVCWRPPLPCLTLDALFCSARGRLQHSQPCSRALLPLAGTASITAQRQEPTAEALARRVSTAWGVPQPPTARPAFAGKTFAHRPPAATVCKTETRPTWTVARQTDPWQPRPILNVAGTRPTTLCAVAGSAAARLGTAGRRQAIVKAHRRHQEHTALCVQTAKAVPTVATAYRACVLEAAASHRRARTM